MEVWYSVIVHKVNKKDEGGESVTQADRLLGAWVKLSWIVKNNRITKGLMYNEATVMMLLYNKYKEDGIGLVSFGKIQKVTGMLKSLLNRTINSLEKKGLLQKSQGVEDKRILFLKVNPEKLDVFLEVHSSSLKVASGIIDIIGKEDADNFIRIVGKLERSGYKI